MRLTISMVIAGLLLPQPGTAQIRSTGRTSDGLCRRPSALPTLRPEPKLDKAGNQYGKGSFRPAPPIVTSAVLAPPPPPPPAPVPPPPVDASRITPPSMPVAPPAPAAPPAPGSSIVVTGSRVSSDDIGRFPEPASSTDPKRTGDSAFTRRHPSQNQPHADLLTAGEHDDLLNPELYAAYVDRFLAREPLDGIPRVDTQKTLTVAVRDQRGQPVRLAPVTLTCSDGNTLTLATVADGTVTFFPSLDRLGDDVRIGVPGAAVRRVTMDGASTQTMTVTRAKPVTSALDLAVVLDTTGSMDDEIAFLQTELRAILDRVRARHPGLSLRIALIVYRDEGDDYVTRTYPFTGDLAALQRNLAAQSAGGGGDTPEAVEQALARAVGLDWRPSAVKSLLWVADAPPHADDIARSWQAVEVLRAKRVQVVPVASSGTDRGAEYIMRAAAAATQSRYLFLTDDSGVGNPHAPPAIDCYKVTSLADAVRRTLDAQLSGRRIEPVESQVIRTVGTYDAGRCVLPSGWPSQNGQ